MINVVLKSNYLDVQIQQSPSASTIQKALRWNLLETTLKEIDPNLMVGKNNQN